MTHPWWLHYEGEQPTIDDLPTSSRAAEVRTALNMVDREREEREKLRAEVKRLREALRALAEWGANRELHAGRSDLNRDEERGWNLALSGLERRAKAALDA